MPEHTFKMSGGMNRSDESTKISTEDFVLLQNFISHKGAIRPLKGTHRYNKTALSYPVTWLDRYYGILADGTRVKKTFLFSNGTIYVGNDVTGELTSSSTGFTTETLFQESITVQVSGRSRMYFFSGKDIPYYHEGDSGNNWYKSGMLKTDGTPYKPVQAIEYLQRLFIFEENSSQVPYSKVNYYENFTDSSDAGELTVRRVKDSTVKRLVLLGDYLYIFKSDSIHVLEGRTPTTFRLRLVTDKYGLLDTRAICKVGSSYIFVNSLDKEIYSFGGTEPSIKLMSRKLRFSEILNNTKSDRVCMIEHDKLCRISFWNREALPQNQYNSYEAVFPTDETGSDGEPKWSLSKGANISCYSIWDEQGDNNVLVTGRSDIGCIVYHGRGWDWDDTPREYIARTGDALSDLGANFRIDDIWIDGTQQNGKDMYLRTYLDGRIKGSTYTNQTVDLDSETKALAAMSLPITNRFKTRITPLIGYSKGNAISLEFYGLTKNLQLVISSAKISYHMVDKTRKYITGG